MSRRSSSIHLLQVRLMLFARHRYYLRLDSATSNIAKWRLVPSFEHIFGTHEIFEAGFLLGSLVVGVLVVYAESHGGDPLPILIRLFRLPKEIRLNHCFGVKLVWFESRLRPNIRSDSVSFGNVAKSE